MTFDQWWDEHWSLLGASEAIRRKEVAKRAWDAATAAERERCAKIVDRWHIRKGGYSALAEAIRSGGEGGRG